MTLTKFGPIGAPSLRDARVDGDVPLRKASLRSTSPICPDSTNSVVVADNECIGMLRISCRRLLQHGRHLCACWATFQSLPEIRKLLGRADGVSLDAAIAQIAHVTADMQALRRILRKIAEADALHKSRYEESPCLLRVRHKRKNCSRESQILCANALLVSGTDIGLATHVVELR
jgi:hypothetical protein